MASRWGNNGNSEKLFSWAPKSLQMVSAAMKLKDAFFLEGSYDKWDSILKSRDITLPTKVWLVKAVVFPVVMHGCELDCEESWVPKNWCFWSVVLEKTLESHLDCMEIQPVHPKGDRSWVFIGKIDAKTPVLWPPHVKSWLIGKDPDAGEGLGAGGEGDDRGWDGWMPSLTQWTCVRVYYGSWWWTGRPCVLRLMESQRVGHSWAIELNWLEQ